eukprot:1492632-Prymnesium_polylepis.2
MAWLDVGARQSIETMVVHAGSFGCTTRAPAVQSGELGPWQSWVRGRGERKCGGRSDVRASVC